VCSIDIISGGLWRTINGGGSWIKQLGVDYDPSKIFFINSNTGWVIGNVTNLYKTTNCGTNWFFQDNLGTTTTDVFFPTLDTGWIIKGATSAGYNDAILRSINGGNNWDSLNAPAVPTESRLFFIENKIGWAGSAPHIIYVTKDGYNWGHQYSPQFAVVNTSFVDSLHGWAGYGGLVHTVDGGGPILSINKIGAIIPEDFMLEQNYPNPFNSKSNIKYKISKKVKGQTSKVKLIVYDITGKQVTTLVDKEQEIGEYNIMFDGNNLGSGIYFYSLYANGVIVGTKKLILLK
jgi:hypothetical protein